MSTRSAASRFLDGRPGREGFLFHDGHNQPVHQAAPGLLGLVEARPVMGRWKPQILRWLDETDHFFNHLLAEFDGDTSFEPVRRELQEIHGLDATLAVKNRFLFQYLTAVTRELERREAARSDQPGPERPRPERPRPERVVVAVGDAPASVGLGGPWRVRHRRGPGEYVEEVVAVPVNWELIPGIDNYAGTMRFTRVLALDPVSSPPAGPAGPAAGDPAGDEMEGRKVRLWFGGVDYFADVWVNGHHVGGHEGYFAPFELDITRQLRFGEDNIVRLAVTSPNDPSGTGTHVTSAWNDFSPASSFPNRKTLVKGTLGHHDARRGGAWSCVTSQDGNTGGVWGDVGLRIVNPVHFPVGGVRITTRAAVPAASRDGWRVSARITVAVENQSGRSRSGRLRVRLEPANFEGDAHELVHHVALRPGENQVVLDDELAPVRLWHPRDRGFPHLYTVTADLEVQGVVVERAVVETGFRTLAVNPIGESTGPDGAFVVNGERLFVRGTNLLPTYWLSEYTPARVRRDFDMLREAGFNAVLVHNVVAPRHFYAQADREGFLVVQMFPLQWSYEQSAEFEARAAQQIHDLAHQLANHPSVVSYDVHNEPDMRTFEDLDNRLMDFDLHAVLRQADPSRWASTFSGGNHAYPGQFYPLRDDNSFVTLPGRFLEKTIHGRRISRHRNMPTEFGIQAMPNNDLFRELLSEARVRQVLERIRTDPKWLAAGGETWEEAEKAIDEVKDALGDGAWDGTLAALDWTLLWEVGGLDERLSQIERARAGDESARRSEWAELRLALLLLDVLHYGGFKGENFWFGLWRPAHSLEDLVRSSQDRQYRMHKESIETFLNAGVVGPIVGYFSFMFRDADWQAPTWGVVDAGWVPKKAYRAYVESNQPVRVSLPKALRAPVKLPGDPWFAADEEDQRRLCDAPWAASDLIVANDTRGRLPGAHVTIWLEDAAGHLPLVSPTGQTAAQADLTIDLEAGRGWSGAWPGPRWTVPDEVAAGTYFLNAQVATADGEALSTNRYELVVPDVSFGRLRGAPAAELHVLLEGAPRAAGFHYWHEGVVAYRAHPGLGGLLAGWHEAGSRGIDRYEVIQGEHLFRHVLGELGALADRGSGPAATLVDELWRIRSEVLSPWEKTRALVRYVERFVRWAQDETGQGPREENTPW